jgi:oligopeptidase B
MRLTLLLASAASAALLTGCTMPAEKPSSTAPITAQETAEKPSISPPMAKRVDKTITQIGRTRTDPYSWLKDENWQDVMKDPSLLQADIREYLEAENAYTMIKLEQPTEALREDIFNEMRGRIKEDDASLANIDGPYAYFSKYREGGEYPIFARRDASDVYNEDADANILLDGDALSKDKSYFSFGGVGHSPDHKLMAYSVDENGSEQYQIRFRDVATGKDLPDTVDGTAGGFTWSENSDAVYWVERDDNARPVAVHRYALGSDGSTEVYREDDPGFFTSVGKTQSGKFILINVGDQVTSEVRVFPADSPDPKPVLIAARDAGIEYSVEHWGDQFVITTNDSGAIDMKIVTAPVDAPGKENWEELVPHDPGTLILDTETLKDHLIRLERKDGLPRIVVRTRDGTESEIDFDEAAYDLDFSTGYQYDTDTIRIDYSSPTTPDQEYDYSLKTGERILRKTREVPSGHIPEDYVVERIMAPARDGVLVPVTILRHKDTPVDGSAPVLLYGYGSYGITISAGFRITPLSLVDRGFIYATAHVRGSKAKGYQWYLDGKLKTKIKTFEDYVDVGRHLVAENYTAEGKIVGQGGSAGGLLMGAAVNLDPELFGGIIAAVPFVDVINTMSDDTLPLTPPEWPEWGNPITSAEDYDTILTYSPYDNVGDKPYPTMLITGGLTDPRVTYWEPAKWVAKLRHEAPNAGPYFLRINMDSGHGGASGRFEGLKETAIEYAFALAAVGKTDDVDMGD